MNQMKRTFVARNTKKVETASIFAERSFKAGTNIDQAVRWVADKVMMHLFTFNTGHLTEQNKGLA